MGKYLNYAIYSWHYRRGFVKEKSFPNHFSLEKDVLEPIFFLTLKVPIRRVEPFLYTYGIRGKAYYWYFFGSYSETPRILIVDTNIENPKLLLMIMALNLRLSDFKAIAPIPEEDFVEFIKEMDRDSNRLLYVLTSNPVIANILNIIFSFGEITFSELVNETSYLSNPPTYRELDNLLTILLNFGVIDIKYVRGEIDKLIVVRKFLIPEKNVDVDYLRNLKSRLRSNFLKIREKMVRILEMDRERFEYPKILANFSKILIWNRCQSLILKLDESIVLKKNELNPREIGLVEELKKIGVVGELNNKIFLMFKPRIKVVDVYRR